MNQLDTNQLQLDVLYGVKFTEDNLIVSVRSSDCTSKEDFKVLTSLKDAQSERLIAVVRINPDDCGIVSTVVDITFSWAELGLNLSSLRATSIAVANPFGVLEERRAQPMAATPA
jgi:hypothetical protein